AAGGCPQRAGRGHLGSMGRIDAETKHGSGPGTQADTSVKSYEAGLTFYVSRARKLHQASVSTASTQNTAHASSPAGGGPEAQKGVAAAAGPAARAAVASDAGSMAETAPRQSTSVGTSRPGAAPDGAGRAVGGRRSAPQAHGPARAGRVAHDQEGQAQPLPHGEVEAAHRPREQRQDEARFHVPGDARRRDGDRAQGEHEREH